MRLLCIAAVALLGATGCTFGISRADLSVSSESALTFDTFAFDARGPALIDTTLILRGDGLASARSTARVVGLVTSSTEELRSGVALPYALQGSSLSLGVEITGPRADAMWVETLTVRLPRQSEIFVTSPYVHVDIDGTDAPITVQGARDVWIGRASDVQLTRVGDVDVHATSGTIQSEAGQIKLTLDAPLTGPFELSTRAGEIVITRSASTAFVLVIDSPDCRLDLDGTVTHIEGHFEQSLGEGGPRVHVSQSPHVRIVHTD